MTTGEVDCGPPFASYFLAMNEEEGGGEVGLDPIHPGITICQQSSHESHSASSLRLRLIEKLFSRLGV